MMALASTADGLAHGIKHMTLLWCASPLSPTLDASDAPTFHNLNTGSIVRETEERLNCRRRAGETWGENLYKGRPLLHTTHTTGKQTKPGNKEQPSHRPRAGNDNETAVFRVLPAARKPIPLAAASDRNNPWTRDRDRGFTHPLGAPAAFACLRIGHGGHGKSKNKADWTAY